MAGAGTNEAQQILQLLLKVGRILDFVVDYYQSWKTWNYKRKLLQTSTSFMERVPQNECQNLIFELYISYIPHGEQERSGF